MNWGLPRHYQNTLERRSGLPEWRLPWSAAGIGKRPGKREMKLSFAVQRAARLCPDISPENITRRLSYSSYVNLDRRYLYFEAPKAACSTMKWLLHSVERLPPIRPFVGPNREARRDMFIHVRENLPIPSLLQLDDDEQEFVLTSPEVMRFTVVRNPYTRLESAWKDKVQLCAPGYEDLCIDIKGALPAGDDPASLVSFREFVTAVEGQDIARCDSHWRAQWEHTLRGAMNFSHVGRTEDLPAQLTVFFDHIGEPNRAVPQLNVIDRGTEYTDEIAERVYRLYRRDFDAFDYAQDSWPRPPARARGRPLIPLDRFIDEVLERNIVIGRLYVEREALTRRLSDPVVGDAADQREPESRPARPASKHAVVTPYHRETREVLERCIQSVRDQTVAADHVMVSDGFPQDWVDGAGVRHIRLDRSYADYGDTPRGIGAILAAQEGYETIGFLDADCWLEPDHVEYCLELAAQAGPDACDYVVAFRNERRPDGSLMEVNQPPPHRHVDTNCFFFLRSGFHVLPVWASIPQEVSAVGDRLFYNAVRANNLRPQIAKRKTVNYTCLWESIYLAIGEDPPAGAKPNPDHQAIEAWIKERSAGELTAINRSIQSPLEQLYPLYKDTATTPNAKAASLMPSRPTQVAKPGAATICLNMIVKNEAPVIARCLNSARPLIDHWVIVDTGSTDGTPDIIRETLKDVPGELHERSWRDFASNRSEALTLARPHADYSLIIDADDTFDVPAAFERSGLDRDSYVVDIRDGSIRYQRTQLVRNTLPWRYEGVLHEYLTCEGAGPPGHLDGVVMQRNHDGARRRDPDTYRRDVAVLEEALATEANPFLVARYTFYLAQSYRDCGEKKKAAEAYSRRSELGYWDQEVFYSLYQTAKIKEELGEPDEAVIALYLRASDAAANRAEALHGACRVCRVKGRNQEGYEIGKRGLSLRQPEDGLFVEPWIYEYGLRDEFSVNAYWAGHYKEALDAGLEALGCETLPAGHRQRLFENARFAVDKVADAAVRDLGGLRLWALGEHAPEISPASPSVIAAVPSGLVSIITPTRDRSAMLQRARAFIRSQDYPDIEWLVLDDSPEPDRTLAATRNKRLTYIHEERQEPIGAKRNQLIDRAKGEFIVQFDDDDYYAPGYVSTMLRALAEKKAGLINLRGWYLYDLRSRFFGYWDMMRKVGPHYRCDRNGVSLIVLDERHAPDFEHNHLGFGFSYVFRRSVWERAKFPEVNFDEDGGFSLAAQEHAKVDGIYDTTGLCLHLLHERSSSCCWPQHHLPSFLYQTLFPDLQAPADNPSRGKL
jgi:glycosyltransferase involved in cell wall biosynthesis